LLRLRVHFLRRCARLAVLDLEPQRVFRNVLHCAEEGDGVEIVEEAEVCHAEDLALHLTLSVGGDQRKLRFQRLYHCAGIHTLRNGNRGCSGRRRCWSEESETEG